MTTPLIEAIARKLCINDDRNPDDPFFVNSPDGLRQWKGYEFDAMTALTAITEAGHAVVPVEPTEAMLERGCGGIEGNGRFPPSLADSPIDSQWVAEAYCCYRAMISAAQGDG